MSAARLIGLLALAWLSGPAAAQAPSAPAQPIRIATEGAYPPFNYVENNEPAGFEIELGRAMCEAMAATCTFVLQDWDGMVSGLKERRYDAIMSSMEITKERRHRVAFSKRYYAIPAALMASKATAADAGGGIPDLVGKSVGVVADSEFAGYLESTYRSADIRPFGKQEEANLDLLTGRLDYVLGDKLEISKFLDSREGKMCCRFIGDLPVNRGEGVGVAVRKGDTTLLEFFNAAIDRVIASGAYDRIRAKYVPFDIR
ncbi:transporter substrate-binding domain-containing protein [Enterovirga sp. CN4-39]|uniref:transporter substrate-binding domain-containing protein n=1 Tax=Enterovirga sp. CN4-39 TaxID=3400910 RepID=UPI003C0B6F1A